MIKDIAYAADYIVIFLHPGMHRKGKCQELVITSTTCRRNPITLIPDTVAFHQNKRE